MFAFNAVTVPSLCCFQHPEYPASRQQLKFMVSRVCAVFQDAAYLLKTASVIGFLQRGEGWPKVFSLWQFRWPFEVPCVPRFNWRNVKRCSRWWCFEWNSGRTLPAAPSFFEDPQKVEAMWVLLHNLWSFGGPSEVCIYVQRQGTYSWAPQPPLWYIYVYRLGNKLPIPIGYNQFFKVLRTRVFSAHQPLNFSPVWCLITVQDESHHGKMYWWHRLGGCWPCYICAVCTKERLDHSPEGHWCWYTLW